MKRDHRTAPGGAEIVLEPLASLDLPVWACASESRRRHIARVTALLDRWAAECDVSPDERAVWHDAGRFHDALRDADDDLLRELAREFSGPADMLHGPAVAERLRRDGETRKDLLDAVRWHTVGSASWGRPGQALYMADYLEPGRRFGQADRQFLAALVPTDFAGVFRQVVRQRLEWSLREGKGIFPETAALWNAVR